MVDELVNSANTFNKLQTAIYANLQSSQESVNKLMNDNVGILTTMNGLTQTAGELINESFGSGQTFLDDMNTELGQVAKEFNQVKMIVQNTPQLFEGIRNSSAEVLNVVKELGKQTMNMFDPSSFTTIVDSMNSMGNVINNASSSFSGMSDNLTKTGTLFTGLSTKGAEASNWITSSVPQMAVKFGELFGGLSAGSSKAIESFTSMAGNILTKGSEITASIGTTIGQVGEFASAIGEKMAGAYETWNSATQMVSSTMEGYQTVQTAVTSLTKGWQLVQASLNATFLANPIVWIVVGIAALIAAIALVVSKTEGWQAQWDNLKAVLTNTWQRLQLQFQVFVQKMALGWAKVKAAFGFGDDGAVEKEKKKLEELQSSLQNLEKNAPKLENKLQWKKDDKKKATDNKGNASTITGIQTNPGKRISLAQKQTKNLNSILSKSSKGRRGKSGRKTVGNKKMTELRNSLDKMSKKAPNLERKFSSNKKKKKGIGSRYNTPNPSTKFQTPPKSTLSQDNSTQQSVSGITGGGSKQTNITVSVGKLVETIEVHSESLREGVAEIRDAVQDELLRVLNSANRLSY